MRLGTDQEALEVTNQGQSLLPLPPDDGYVENLA